MDSLLITTDITIIWSLMNIKALERSKSWGGVGSRLKDTQTSQWWNQTICDNIKTILVKIMKCERESWNSICNIWSTRKNVVNPRRPRLHRNIKSWVYWRQGHEGDNKRRTVGNGGITRWRLRSTWRKTMLESKDKHTNWQTVRCSIRFKKK